MKEEESKNGVAKAKGREPEEEWSIISVSIQLSHDAGSSMRFGSGDLWGPSALPQSSFEELVVRNPTAVSREMKSC